MISEPEQSDKLQQLACLVSWLNDIDKHTFIDVIYLEYIKNTFVKISLPICVKLRYNCITGTYNKIKQVHYIIGCILSYLIEHNLYINNYFIKYYDVFSEFVLFKYFISYNPYILLS